MKISIVIPAYNEEAYIFDCLQSLMDQSEKPDEIIVVDNNSTDKTADIARQFPVRLLTEKKKGTIAARNTGFDAASFPIIGRIDADTRLPKDWVKKIKAQFSKDKTLIGYSGPTIFKEKTFNTLFAFPEKVLLSSFKKVIGTDLLYGPNMAIRKSAWEKIKTSVCMQDKLFHEDVDLTIHLSKLPQAKTVFDKTSGVTASDRRWKLAYSYIEYPYRYVRTVQHHQYPLRITSKQIGKITAVWKKHLVSIQDSFRTSPKL